MPLQSEILSRLNTFARALGGIAIGITDTNLTQEESGLTEWINQGYHGEMDYMSKNRELRHHPEQLHEATVRIISVAFPYTPHDIATHPNHRFDPEHAYIARYALSRDYHKVVRKKLDELAKQIYKHFSPHRYRVFADSAPIREVALASKAGIGWRGKNTLLISRELGSFFFIGEILTDLELPMTSRTSEHCGRCERCLHACPTRAIFAPYKIDARRCISYLTIEYKGAIPMELRKSIGNRIFGCDDCQLACPWNRFAQKALLPDWAKARHHLDDALLVDLFSWDEATFDRNTQGSPIRRIRYEQWQRNIAIAMGNALSQSYSPAIWNALKAKEETQSALVKEHVLWALAQSSVTPSS